MEFLDQGLQRLLRPAQIKLFFIVLGFEITSFFVGSVYPMSLATAISTTSSYTASTKSIYALNPLFMWFEIVSHNAIIVTFELFPILGLVVNTISTFTTGQILHATVLTQASMSSIGGLGLAAELFLFPHTIVEFSAYALATSSSILFFFMLIKWWRATRIKMPDGTPVYFENRKQAKEFEALVKEGKPTETRTVNGYLFGVVGQGIEGQPSQTFMEKYEPTAETLRVFSRAISASLFLLAIAGLIEVVIIQLPLVGMLFWLPIVLGANYLRKWIEGRSGKQWDTASSSRVL